MSLEIAISLLTAIGIGSILGAFFQSRFEHQKQIREQEHELKHRRYGAILILMLTKLDPKTGLPHTRAFRPDLKDLSDVDKEIETELLNGVLFASDGVIRAMAEFIRNPGYLAYIRTAVAMRKDLWGRKTSVDEQVLSVITGEPKSS